MTEERDFPDDALLLDHVRGRADAETSRRIEEAAAERPELAAEIALMRAMGKALEQGSDEGTPGELGWARLSRAIDAETQGDRARRPAGRVVLLWQAAAAAAAAVVLWQAVAVPLIPGRLPDTPGYVPVTEAPAEAFTVSVAFVPEATEARIRALLAEAGATVTGGPSAIGLWRLGFDSAEARDRALELFAAAPDVVESAQPD